MTINWDLLPKTRARLSTSILLYIRKGAEGDYHLIGAANRLAIDVRKDVTRRRAFGSEVPGYTVEITPNASEITASLRNAVLYKGSLLEALGFKNFEDLIFQNVPLHIKVEFYEPGATEATLTIWYEECYVTRTSKEYSLEREFIVFEEMDLEVARVKVVPHPKREISPTVLADKIETGSPQLSS